MDFREEGTREGEKKKERMERRVLVKVTQSSSAVLAVIPSPAQARVSYFTHLS
jgi:hypothetical protein